MSLGCREPRAFRERLDRTVFAWAECQDCMHDEEARVVALGDTVVPRLQRIVVNGPPPEHVDAVRGRLLELARRLPPSRAPSAVIIEAQLDKFRAMYRLRAAVALAAIGTSRARRALCAGRKNQSPNEDVRAAIDSGIARLGGSCP
jgi:hypothetical protein